MKIRTLRKNNTTKVINETLRVLGIGGLVIFPSDTVYGALVDATNEIAVRRLAEFKSRPLGKAVSVFVSGFSMLKDLAVVNKNQEILLKELLPGPFTVVLQSKNKVCKLLESEKGTLGIRIPRHQSINQLMRKFRRPVTATSANLSGYAPHYSIDPLLNRLPESKKKLINLIIDTGKLPRNKPSTVIDLTQAQIKILRQGEIIFKNQKTYLSKTPEQTKKIAQFLANKLLLKSKLKPVVVIIEGELGVGKTVFVKGVGESLGIKNIVSPTFVIYYEYDIEKSKVKSQKSKFIHLDLYNIQEKEEFKYLEIERLLKPGNILAFEWGEKAGEITNLLKSKGKIVYVKMEYINEKEREIRVNF